RPALLNHSRLLQRGPSTLLPPCPRQHPPPLARWSLNLLSYTLANPCRMLLFLINSAWQPFYGSCTLQASSYVDPEKIKLRVWNTKKISSLSIETDTTATQRIIQAEPDFKITTSATGTETYIYNHGAARNIQVAVHNKA
ncbi:unnamed protein product, partial [Ectocarpus sp. 13 AM-2016]